MPFLSSATTGFMAESAFPEAAQAHQNRLGTQREDHEAAARAVPIALIDATSVVGTPAECRARLEAYYANRG